MDLGNISAAALVIGQFVSNRSFSILIFLGGMSLTIACYTISYLISN